MKIAIIGPGAMGCLFAALLSASKGKNDTWVLDKDPQRSKLIDSKGVTVEGAFNLRQAVKVTADAKRIGPVDLIIIFTKSYDTESALNSAKQLISAQTNILSLQNGLGNLELISETVGADRTIGGITINGVTLLDTAKVRCAGKGETIIGKLNGRIFGDLRQISAVFNEAGISTRISKDIDSVIWSKLIVNVGVNAIASICRLPNGALLDHEGTKEILRQAVVEATKLAKRKKIRLIYDDPLQKVESVCKATSDNICSMLQDVLRQKRTEIDYINAAVVRLAKGYGIKTPVNEMLSQIVKTIEAGYKQQIRQ